MSDQTHEQDACRRCGGAGETLAYDVCPACDGDGVGTSASILVEAWPDLRSHGSKVPANEGVRSE